MEEFKFEMPNRPRSERITVIGDKVNKYPDVIKRFDEPEQKSINLWLFKISWIKHNYTEMVVPQANVELLLKYPARIGTLWIDNNGKKYVAIATSFKVIAVNMDINNYVTPTDIECIGSTFLEP